MSTTTLTGSAERNSRAERLRPTVTRRRSARRALSGVRALPMPESLTVQPDDTGETRRRKRKAAYALYLVTAVVATGIALVVWVFPTRTWLSQRDATAAILAKQRVLEAENAQVQAQIRALQTRAEIERVARERYNLVYPNEQAFAVLPPTVPDFPDQIGYNVVRAFFTLTG